MQHEKVTKIAVRGDMAATITSSRHGANLDAVGFNVGFLLQRRPLLAVEILKLYDQARRVREDDPTAPEEDIRAAGEQWDRFRSDVA
jgi:hypothetical protein